MAERQVSPYLRRPLRSLEEVLRQRRGTVAAQRWTEAPLTADNTNGLPPALSSDKTA